MIVNDNPSFEWSGGFSLQWEGEADPPPIPVATVMLGEDNARTGSRCIMLASYKQLLPDPPGGDKRWRGTVAIPLRLQPSSGECTVKVWVKFYYEGYGSVRVYWQDGTTAADLASLTASEVGDTQYHLMEGKFYPRGNEYQYVWVIVGDNSLVLVDDLTIETSAGVYIEPPVAPEGAMPLTDIQLSNMALGRLSIGPPIESMDEATEAAQACNLYFETARDATLEGFDWPFARRTAALVRLTDLEAGSGWDRCYQYPEDCLAVRILLQSDGTAPDIPIEYTVEGNDTYGRVIFTNEVNARIRYTARSEDPKWWPTLFGMALSWQLAAECAPALRVSTELQAMCYQQFAIWLHKAYEAALREGQDPVPLDADWVRARTGSVTSTS